MPTSFVSERFDELTIKQQLALNVLISTVASHSLSFETYEQGKRTRDINEALRVLKMTLEAKPERAIREDRFKRFGVKQPAATPTTQDVEVCF